MPPKRILIKIGTNVLQRPNGKLDYNIISELGEQAAALRRSGHEVVLVSSGAVGAGRELIGTPDERDPLVRQQMLAAVGQVRLMQTYSIFLQEFDIRPAQLLVTRSEFADRGCFLNIRNTLEGLLRAGVLPIVNENDVVATEELTHKFGDNDQLAVHLAGMLAADRVFFLTTATGFHERDPAAPNGRGALIPTVTELTPELMEHCGPSDTPGGRGGMESKVRAAAMVMAMGADAHIVSGKERHVVLRVMGGEALGTHFKAPGKRMAGYRKWIATGAVCRGSLTIDDGAVAALRGKKSLLAAGVTRVEGRFQEKEYIEIRDARGARVGAGRAGLDSEALRAQLEAHRAGAAGKSAKAVVNRNHLVLV